MDCNDTLVMQMVMRDLEQGTNHHRYGSAEELEYTKDLGKCPYRTDDETFDRIADHLYAAALSYDRLAKYFYPEYQDRSDTYFAIWDQYESYRKQRMNDLNILKIDDVSQYLDQIDSEDAMPEFVQHVKENSEEVFAIYQQDTVIGLAEIEDDAYGFVYVYIFPAYRGQGYGSLAVQAAEQQIKASPLKKLTTACMGHCEAAKRFAEKNGYMGKFASAFMRYSGGTFPEPEIKVRKYRDEDFVEAYAMTDEAFHIMRLGTGCFPDSALTEPNEEDRKECAENADN